MSITGDVTWEGYHIENLFRALEKLPLYTCDIGAHEHIYHLRLKQVVTGFLL